MKTDDKISDSILLILQVIVGSCVVFLAFRASGILSQASELHTNLESTVVVTSEIKKDRDANAPLTKGMEAPEFSLLNENGDTVNLQDYKGKKVLLQFSSLSCESCLPAVMAAKELQEKRDDVNILLVQYVSPPDDNALFKKDLGLPFPVLSAEEEMAKKYQAYYIPFSILIDEGGKIEWSQRIESLKGFELFLRDKS